MIEREIRFKIDDDILDRIIAVTTPVQEKIQCIDLCMGEYGFDSLDKKGYIIRIRKKNGKVVLESKKRLENNSWQEECIEMNNFKEPYYFLKNIGLEPYLYINRQREIRENNVAEVYIDEIELLGTFVEFELKQGKEFEDLEYVIKELGICSNPEKLYGDIFKEKLNDERFKKVFESKLNEFLKEN